MFGNRLGNEPLNDKGTKTNLCQEIEGDVKGCLERWTGPRCCCVFHSPSTGPGVNPQPYGMVVLTFWF